VIHLDITFTRTPWRPVHGGVIAAVLAFIATIGACAP